MIREKEQAAKKDPSLVMAHCLDLQPQTPDSLQTAAEYECVHSDLPRL